MIVILCFSCYDCHGVHRSVILTNCQPQTILEGTFRPGLGSQKSRASNTNGACRHVWFGQSAVSYQRSFWTWFDEKWVTRTGGEERRADGVYKLNPSV